MKINKLILTLVFCFGLTACGGSGASRTNAVPAEPTPPKETKDRVEVLYFHRKQRCVSCMAIEKNIQEALGARFADELKDGTVVFKSIDISKTENEKMAGKYEVTWWSLFVSQWKDGKETYENLTDYAFAHARKTPETFKGGVIEKVETLLK